MSDLADQETPEIGFLVSRLINIHQGTLPYIGKYFSRYKLIERVF